jgi:carbon-monoxide dehydrogenase iron sulfur subunit
MAKAIIVDIDKCLACKSCEIACAVAHSKSEVLEQALTESPKPQKRVTVEAVEQFSVPMQCRHCEDAPCITICPTGAISRRQQEGPVLIDAEKCIGCKYCLVVCPFGVINISQDGKVAVKCDLCLKRTEAGEEPACVQACPTKALKLVEQQELTAGKRRRAARELVLSTRENNNKRKRKEKTR